MTERIGQAWRQYWVEICWWIFVMLNVAGILMFREWATVPFHFIWISLSLLYGARVWGLRATSISLTVIIIVTGVSLGADIISGDQAVDELTEIPLMSAVFAAMVVFVRRSVAAREEIRRLYKINVGQLEYVRYLIRHASHIVRTPLTIALGHAEILQRTTPDVTAASDAQVVIDELMRLKQATDRLLELATSQESGFVRPVDTPLRAVLADVCDRWSDNGVPVCLGEVDDAVLPLDADRLQEALDELIGNAAAGAPPAGGAHIEVSARQCGDRQVVAVADRGPGITEDPHKPIFDRFSRADGNGRRGARLGLAIVRAIAEAHGGSLDIRGRPGGGAVVEFALPLQAQDGHPPPGWPR